LRAFGNAGLLTAKLHRGFSFDSMLTLGNARDLHRYCECGASQSPIFVRLSDDVIDWNGPLGYVPRSMTYLSYSGLTKVCAFGFLCQVSFAQAVDDPIPQRIEKGEVRVELQPVATGLAAPLLLAGVPDRTNRQFVVDQAGQIRVIAGGKLLPEAFLDVSGRLVELNPDFDERGLLGLALDPGFSDAASPGYRRFFTSTSEAAEGAVDLRNPNASEKPDHHSVIASWKISAANPNRADMGSRQELLRIEQPQFNHNSGMIAFGPDGFLYIGLGDGGGANDAGPGHHPEKGNAQDPQTPLGKMLRVDVNGKNSANGKYGIPQDNPFVKGGGLPEIFALGLRNPYRFSFDGTALLAGDVGQNKMEMLHRVERGGNYGWRLKEGTFRFKIDGTIYRGQEGLPPGLTDPILQYDRNEGTSVIGGFVYRGKKLPALAGKYVFGDYHDPRGSSGRLFYADLATGEISEFRIGRGDRELGFLLKGMGQDQDGELYAVGGTHTGPSKTTGVVMKIVPVP
jgi:glucose/arabinose dehydrogenase